MLDLKALGRTATKTYLRDAEYPDHRIKISVVGGSFLAMRIDDPRGVIPVKLATEIAVAIGQIFQKENFVESWNPMNGVGYYMEGVIANWPIKK